MPPYRVPRQGGTLRIGAASGSATDTLDDATPSALVDFMRITTLFGALLEEDVHHNVVPALAEEVTPNKAGDVWTVRLRQGVEFHDGKPFTVDDVLFSIHYHLSVPFSIFQSDLAAIGFDLKNGVQKLDPLTVRFTLSHPYVIFDEFPIKSGYWIVPQGYNPAKPNGTGPFMYKSFTPGQESVFARHPHYWGHPPYLDELVIVDLPDDSARVNALLAGQVDAIQTLPVGSIAQIKGNTATNLMVTPTADWNPLVMRMDVRPFSDVRVRQAFRLLVDRQAVLEEAVGGYGSIANDLYTPTDPVYASDIPQRPHDPQQAKALLKAAGYDGDLSVTLVTSPIAAGLVETCDVFQAQAAAVGVKVNVSQTPAGTFYGKQYLERPFTVDFFEQPFDYFPMVGTTDGAPNAVLNATHNHDARYQALYRQGLTTVDFNLRKEIAHEMQVIEHDSGGYIIPYFPSAVEAVSSKTAGWQNWPNDLGLNGWHFEHVGFA